MIFIGRDLHYRPRDTSCLNGIAAIIIASIQRADADFSQLPSLSPADFKACRLSDFQLLDFVTITDFPSTCSVVLHSRRRLARPPPPPAADRYGLACFLRPSIPRAADERRHRASHGLWHSRTRSATACPDLCQFLAARRTPKPRSSRSIDFARSALAPEKMLMPSSTGASPAMILIPRSHARECAPIRPASRVTMSQRWRAEKESATGARCLVILARLRANKALDFGDSVPRALAFSRKSFSSSTLPTVLLS